MPQGMHSAEERSFIGPAIVLAALVVVAVLLISTAMCSSGDPVTTEDKQQTAQQEAQTTKKAEDKASEKKTGKDADKAASSEKAKDEKTGKDAAGTTAATGSDSSGKKDLSAYTICIDAGHSARPDSTPSPNSPYAAENRNIPTEPGGTDGPKAGAEYAICLEVALELQKDLEEHGINVVQVRTTNNITISPKDRALIANECDADMFVRLHCDSAGKNAEGFYTLVPAKKGYQAQDGLYKKSQSMGEQMHKFIVRALKAKDRGITVRADQGGFNWCTQPSVLFEMANLANAADDERMASAQYKAKLAQAISDACADYLQGLS